MIRSHYILQSAMADEIDENDERTLALEIMDGRKCLNTKKQYRLKVEHFRKWLEAKHPDCLRLDTTIDLTKVDKVILKEFLGHACKKKERDGSYKDPVIFHAFQHVSGYKSAIKDYYSNMEVEFSEDILKMFKQFFEGYVRRVAQLKQDGIMPIIEGKQAMSFKGYKFLALKAGQSRYILEGEGGDQVCGRAASGLPLTDVSFANLPPHFLHSYEDCLSTEEWEEFLPGYKKFYPSNFREVIPYLLASLIYHQPYLVTLSLSNPGHPLFLQRIWTSGVLIRMKEMVGAGCNRNPVSKMTATGVPPHLVLAHSIVGLQEDIGLIKESIVAKLEQLPEALKQAMLQNFQIEGTVPITRHAMQEMMRLSISDLKTTIETSLQSIAQRGALQPLVTGVIENRAQAPEGFQYSQWNWGGRNHPVPQGFEIPV